MSEVNKNLGHATAYGYAKSKGYTGTEEQFAELMASYADVAEDAAQSASEAAQSATAAAASATNAASSASGATQSAQSASASATSASQSATAATSAVSTAQTAAQTATTKASEASQSATNAASSATTANSAADDATAAKTAAETAKTAAQQSATSAATSAQTAQDVLESIPEDYSDLSNDVDDLKSAVEHLTDNLINVTTEAANPLVITDGGDGLPVKDCTVNIQPNQPNKYDSVWVGGAGKNKLPSPVATTKTNNGITISVNNGVYSISGTATAQAEIIFDLPSTVNISIGQKTAYLNDAINADVVVYYRYNNTNGASMVFSNSTNRVSNPYTQSGDVNKIRFLISSGAVISGTLHASPMLIDGSEANPTTFTPYSNICPISGWTEADIHRCGVNQWDEEWEVGGISNAGNNYPNTDRIRSKNYIPVIAGETYYYSIGVATTYGIWTWGYDANKNYVCRIPSTAYAIRNQTVTIPNNVHYIRFVCQQGYGTTYNNNISINYPSTDTAYHAYVGTTYSVDLSTAGTVYGGTLDVTTGVLTVTKKMLTLNGSENWNTEYYAVGYRYYIRTSQSDAKNETVMQSSAFNTTGAFLIIRDADAPKCVNFYANTEYSMFTTLSEFTTYLASNPVQAVYELATPQTYQLTPTEVTTLLKNNTLTANCGTVSLSYYADTKTYIDNAIATAVASL